MTPEAEALILAHLSLVERIAKGVAKRMPAWIEMDELVAAGNVGLCEAAEKYRPELNPSFPYWAWRFIRGRMIDAYRGRNYPRLTTSMPGEWLNDGHELAIDGSRATNHLLPPELIDPSPNPEELVLAQERQSALILDVEFAKRRLSGVEKRATDRHLKGKPMREIGAKEGRSGAWAHYTIHRGRNKLAEQLKEYDPDEKKAA